MTAVHPDSVIFITLDSCRFDTFERASPLGMSQIGQLHRAQAPSYFTYGSHCAMFVGFTPTATFDPVPLLNPKRLKLFKLAGAGYPGKGGEGFQLTGANIVEGFANRGYCTIGSGAVGWFNPNTPTGVFLTQSFASFLYDGAPGAVERQVAWIESMLPGADQPAFVFLNCGETHTPYWHQGAGWSFADNCCLPFQKEDRSSDCASRQTACLRHVDQALSQLLAKFMQATVLICADHGDAWGENGVWEHGIPHEKVLTVPMLMRYKGTPI